MFKEFEAHWILSNLRVQASPGESDRSGRRTVKPAVGLTGDQGKGFGFPNKVTVVVADVTGKKSCTEAFEGLLIMMA